jgi:hypothetical protein
MVEKETSIYAGTFKTEGFKSEKLNIGKGGRFEPFGKDGFSFLDFLDIINPLQHIPLVATLYRNITGDEIDPGSRLVGSALYGGPIGAVTSLINVMVEFDTGKDIGEHALEMARDGNKKLKNTQYITENKISQDQFPSGNLSAGLSISGRTSEGLSFDRHNVGLNNPFLAEQRAENYEQSMALSKEKYGHKTIEEELRPSGKGQTRYATRAYKEAFYLK